MKILELFSGTESFSKVARERGHETFTVDFDPKFRPGLCKDISELKVEDIPFKPDVVWASPPCQNFSIASVYRHWTKVGKTNPIYKPKDEGTVKSVILICKLLELIKALQPRFWFIENPRGMLRKMYFMKDLNKSTVTYCKYGMQYQKATDIWHNCKGWIPKIACKPQSPCHVRAPRGSRCGVQGLDGYRENRDQKHPIDTTRIKERRLQNHPDWSYVLPSVAEIRAIVPEELCKEILISCEVSHNNSPEASKGTCDTGLPVVRMEAGESPSAPDTHGRQEDGNSFSQKEFLKPADTNSQPKAEALRDHVTKSFRGVNDKSGLQLIDQGLNSSADTNSPQDAISKYTLTGISWDDVFTHFPADTLK